MTDQEFPEVAAMAPPRPANYKKRHRFPKFWAAWCAFTDLVYEWWPRND